MKELRKNLAYFKHAWSLAMDGHGGSSMEAHGWSFGRKKMD